MSPSRVYRGERTRLYHAHLTAEQKTIASWIRVGSYVSSDQVPKLRRIIQFSSMYCLPGLTVSEGHEDHQERILGCGTWRDRHKNAAGCRKKEMKSGCVEPTKTPGYSAVSGDPIPIRLQGSHAQYVSNKQWLDFEPSAKQVAPRRRVRGKKLG